ncbi:hypothetical protein [Carnobacterium sp.]|uniref:hypothetical protein n=1 Tax=Carnobacterium sp. TaxID=48221 RepID=UPI003C71B1D4
METAIKAWINSAVFAILLIVHYFSSNLIKNTNQKELFNNYLTPINPAPFTLSIWGVIYTLIFMSLVVMILNRNRASYRNMIDDISPLFWLSSLLTIGWVVTFLSNKRLISIVFILGLTVVLTAMNRMIVRNNDNKKNFLALTFGLYNGWLLIVSIANLAAYLVEREWNKWGLSEESWGIILLSLAFILAVLMMGWLKNASFTIPAAWACYEMYQFLVSSTELKNRYFLLSLVSIIYMGFLVVGAVIQFKLNRWKWIPAPKRNIYL